MSASATGAQGHTQAEQDSSHTAQTHLSPQLPGSVCHGSTEDSKCYHSEGENKVDLPDLTNKTAPTAPLQEETGAGEERLTVVSHEHREGGGQDGKCQNDEESEETEEEKDGENDGETERGHGEIESDREGCVQEERIKHEEIEGDGEGEEEPEQRVSRRTEREEEHEGHRPPVEEEEEEREQTVGEERGVTDGQDNAEETKDKRKIDEGKEESETKGGENDTSTSTEEVSTTSTEQASTMSTEQASTLSVQVEKEREEGKEGYPEETAEDRHQEAELLLESQLGHRASEGAEQPKVGEGRVEEREQTEKHVHEAEKGGERNVTKETDREGKTDDKLMALGPGLGRTLVVSKQVPPRTQQVKAVPLVPPKPQQSRLTAHNLRQQLQNRDIQAEQRERDTPHRDMQAPDTKTLQQDTQTPKKDAETTQDTQTPNTEILHTREDREHQEQTQTHSSAAQEYADAQLHTDTIQPCGPQSNPPPPGHRGTEPEAEPPHIVISQQQSHLETPEQSQHSTAEQPTELRESEREVEMGGKWGGKERVRQEEPIDMQADWRGGERQSERETGREGSPDVKKDRLSLREGERERRPREREVKRNSGISICFDEAVARATREREREREHSEREKERERGGNVQDEKARL